MDHATSVEEDVDVGVSGNVIQELEERSVGVFGGVGLLLARQGACCQPLRHSRGEKRQ